MPLDAAIFTKVLTNIMIESTCNYDLTVTLAIIVEIILANRKMYIVCASGL